MKQVIFIHVPRTAGKSIAKAIKKSRASYQDLGSPLKPKCDVTIDVTNTQHISIQSLVDRRVFTQDWFDGCFKFAFVRNPWDRLTSLYEHLQYRIRRQRRSRESNAYLHSFSDFANAVCEGHYVRPLGRLATDDWSQANPQVRWLQWGVDFVGRFESLELDWKLLCYKIRIPLIPLEHHNKSSKQKRYRDYYSPDLADKVGEFYKEDIKLFDYSF